MRCCEGLPQQVWPQTSVLPRSPFTVLLKILTRSSTSSLPNALPRTGTMWICGSSIWITGHPALGGLPHGGVLEPPSPYGADNLRKHPRFEEIVEDMAARIGDRADLVGGRLRHFREPIHVGDRVALPAHPRNLLVIM